MYVFIGSVMVDAIINAVWSRLTSGKDVPIMKIGRSFSTNVSAVAGGPLCSFFSGQTR